MTKKLSLSETVIQRNEYKRKYSIWELYRSFVLAPGALSELIRNNKTKLVDKRLVKRLQLAVTEVNGCAACSYQHTQMALKKV